MSKVKVVCWSLLAVLGVTAVGPSIMGAAAGEVNEDNSKVLKIDRADCLLRLSRACLDSQRLESTGDLAQNKEKLEVKGQAIAQSTATPSPMATSSARPSTAAPQVVNGNLELFGAVNIPTTVRLRDLNSSWRAMGTNGPLELGNLQMIVNSSAGGSFAATYYTKGQTVTIGSETYIVAYSLFTLVDKVTPDLPLSLSLLNVKTVGSLSNIRPFDTFKETKVLEKQLAMIKLSNVWDPTKAADPEPSYTPDPDSSPAVTPAPSKKPTRTRGNRNRNRRNR
jgi:hypothetical protein